MDHTSENFKLGGSSLAILTGNELKMSLIPPEHKLSEYIFGKFSSVFFFSSFFYLKYQYVTEDSHLMELFGVFKLEQAMITTK